MKINFLRKIIITILLTTVIISCQFSSDSNQKQNYTPSPSFFWGTWIRMDNGLEYYIDEKKVVTENKEFQIDAKNSDSSTLKIKNMTEFEKQSDSVIINDGIPYFRKGGTDLKYTLKLVGFDNVINSSFRAASGTSLGGVKAKGQSGKYPSYTDENVSDDSGEITLISKTVDDENTVTIDTGDGVVVIPGIKIGNDGDFAGTVPLVGKDDYVLKITGEIPEEEKTDGYLYGNNFKSYPMKLSIKNVSEVTSAFSVCTISSKDPNLIITSNEPIKEGIAISTMKPGAEKVIDINVLYKSISAGYFDAQIDIQIQNAKTGLSWVDCVPLRFYKGLTPITVSAINTESNVIAALNGFVIYPDGNSQFFQVPHNSYNTIYVPTFLKDENYLLAFCGATVEGNLSESTEMFYTVNCGSSEVQFPVTTGTDAIKYYGYGEPNETEDNAFFASKYFQAYLEEGEIDYYKISIAGGEISVPSGKRVYTLNYITEVGVSPETELFTQGDIVDENNLPVLKAENYIFDGWYFNGNKIENSITVNNNIYLVAKWIPVDYSITYELNGGEKSESNPDKYNIQTETIILNSPAKIGYDFAGWYIDKEFKNPITEISKGSFGNKTIYAKWIPTEYLITYVLNEGSNNDENPEFYNIENETVMLKSPSKQNYIFDGWYLNPDFENKIESIVSGSYGKIKLYAKWNPENFLINYELNGGTNYSTNPKIYNIESDEIILQNPEKNAYNFIGWYSDSEFKIENNKIETGSFGNKTFYAKWKPVEYSITYVLNGGTNSESNPNSYNIESNKIVLKKPSKLGYYFTGWYESSSSNKNTICTTIGKGTINNKTFYAKWQPISYDIRYYLFGGINNNSNPQSFSINQHINLYKPTRKGYNFEGWFKDPGYLEEISEISNPSLETLRLYAKWTPQKYSITYNLAGGVNSEKNPDSFSLEDVYLKLYEPVKEGFKFAGWWYDPKTYYIGVNEKYRQAYNITQRLIIENSDLIELNAKWVKYISIDSKEINSLNLSYEQEDIYLEIQGDIKKQDLVNLEYKLDDFSNKIHLDLSKANFINERDGIYLTNLEINSKKISKLITPKNTYVLFGNDVEIRELIISSGASVSRFPRSVQNVELPEGMTSIRDEAFYSSSLQNIIIPDTIKSIGKKAFYGTRITYVKIPVGVERLRNEVFSYCSELEYIDIPNSVSSIEDYAFSYCDKLKCITIPESVSSIGQYCFKGCSLLEKVRIPARVKQLWSGTFMSCSNLREIELPPDIIKIYDCVFLGCEMLESIVLPSNITEIGRVAFSGCENITHIDIPYSVNNIGEGAFSNCINLRSVNIYANIPEIPKSCFSYCYNLNQITIPTTIKMIYEKAFSECMNLPDFILSSGIKLIGPNAFTNGVNVIFSNPLSWRFSDQLYEDGKDVDSDVIENIYMRNIGKYWYRDE